ncbi:MAG: THUMP-like domain-containing protein [Daejeonella sp.]
MNKAIPHEEVQEFIQKNINKDIVRISLDKSPFANISSKELAEQIDSKRRSESKLPLWYNTAGIYYPPKIAIEQCSSEVTAKYKSTLIPGGTIIDLTGGFGVDAYFFSKRIKRVVHCEINKELSAISSFNASLLGVEITYITANGLDYLKSCKEVFDTIYVDPSRRINSRKVFLLKDCEPDLVSNKDLLLEKSSRLLIKTAPLLDIQSTVKELGTVTQVHVLSIKNECKEVLYVIDKAFSESDPPIICAILTGKENLTFKFKMSEEKKFRLDTYSEPLKYLYEPDVALLKAGCFKLITSRFNVKKIHQHTHLYTSDDPGSNFPGRKFKIIKSWTYSAFLKGQKFTKANIICRNFPVTPENIRKKLKIKDGGEQYLLFCKGSNNELLVLDCERIS